MKELSGPCEFHHTKPTEKGYARTHGGYVHRTRYEEKYGKIPEGMQLDHLCQNKACINPDHLEPVTCKENIHRAPKHNVNKTRCPNGHEYTPENTYHWITKKEHSARSCRTCKLLKGCQ